ncbi:TNF receptor-associated factor 2-like [Ostrea edulis]|uniref:TNF receptor-associated factor 2-like n=1 Tax=Ostrea edulis TaxID=37623 RepID=UPI0024AF3428|nr:TNF receptor-associated factor 2-like [Ostrea edulis]XP_056011332.1 TNF receptor-associated factor 2-like [Ostrea edulis]
MASQQGIGGYPVEIFKSEKFDRKFLCNHCSLILRDPVQSYCGHRFCRSCMESVIRSNEQVRCQSCIEEGTLDEEYSILKMDQMFPDNAVRREMGAMHTKCINPKCTWEGTFKQYEGHMAECKFKPVPCQQCGNLIEPQALQDHMTKDCPKRRMTCKHCQSDITVEEMEKHNAECPKYPIKCDSCGKKKIQRDKMKHHLERECSNQKVPCLQECGEISRDKFVDHLDRRPGIHIQALVDQLNSLQTEVNSRLQSVIVQSDLGQFVSHITELKQKVQQQEQLIQTIQASGQGQSGASGSMVESETNVMRQKVQTLELKTGTFEGIVTTLHREIERCITAIENVERNRQADKQMIENQEKKIRALERNISLKDVALAEQELRIKTLELTTYDGTLIWKISEWSKRRSEAQSNQVTSLYSPIFYSSKNGYKMCARLYPNGDGMGKNTHMSIFFVVMRGNFDALLQWPFSFRVTFMLLDQNNKEHQVDSFRPDPNSSSFKRPTTEMNIASGCPLFIPLSKLDDPSLAYVKEDTMFIKLIVDVHATEARR